MKTRTDHASCSSCSVNQTHTLIKDSSNATLAPLFELSDIIIRHCTAAFSMTADKTDIDAVAVAVAVANELDPPDEFRTVHGLIIEHKDSIINRKAAESGREPNRCRIARCRIDRGHSIR